ncbi:hypothetical protein M5C90_31445 [Pseudomonas chlororaphis subsp. piscium]|nr:hypothetical protein M5C90_31445 [Pseudomonas chlororaphis subsp. piscium]
MTKGVCIIECVCEDDPGSEGKVLKEIFNLMQVKSKLIRVKSIKQLLKALTQTEMTHVHIATHGAVTKKSASQDGGHMMERARMQSCERVPYR